MTFGYGSFSSPAMDINVGAGSHSIGNFLSINGARTDRYLDPPEFEALHDHGHNTSVFNRLDSRPSDVGHAVPQYPGGKSDFDVPNTYNDTVDQQQHQNITTYNIAPGYSRVIGSRAVLTANGFVRHDHLTYLPSPDAFDDAPPRSARIAR